MFGFPFIFITKWCSALYPWTDISSSGCATHAKESKGVRWPRFPLGTEANRWRLKESSSTSGWRSTKNYCHHLAKSFRRTGEKTNKQMRKGQSLKKSKKRKFGRRQVTRRRVGGVEALGEAVRARRGIFRKTFICRSVKPSQPCHVSPYVTICWSLSACFHLLDTSSLTTSRPAQLRTITVGAQRSHGIFCFSNKNCKYNWPGYKQPNRSRQKLNEVSNRRKCTWRNLLLLLSPFMLLDHSDEKGADILSLCLVLIVKVFDTKSKNPLWEYKWRLQELQHGCGCSINKQCQSGESSIN